MILRYLTCGLVLIALGWAQAAEQLTGRITAIDRVVPILDQAKPVYHVVKAAARPVIDGKADEWQAIPAMVLDQQEQARGWSGPADLHGGMRLQWDEEGLYFCLEVTDDVHGAPNAEKDWWENDGCQFAFDGYLNGPKAGYDPEEHSYMICDSPDGPLFIGYRMPGAVSEVSKRLDGRTVKMGVGADGMRVYEWAMTWPQLAPVSPWLLGRSGFSFTLNDNDGRGFKGAMFWTRGIVYGQDASGFGQIVFNGAINTQPTALGLRPEEQVTDGQTGSAWLPTADVAPWGTARLLVNMPGGGPVEAKVALYRAGNNKPIATGELSGQAPADKPVVLAWQTGELGEGSFEVEYTLTQPALGTQRLPFNLYNVTMLRARRDALRRQFGIDRPLDHMSSSPQLIRRHRGMVALALQLLEREGWSSAMSNVDKRDEHLKMLAYCARMAAALEQDHDFLQAQRGIFWSAYFSTADGSGQSFVVILPPKFNPDMTYPLIVNLHGAGGVPTVRNMEKAVPVQAIQVMPWARGASAGYRALPENDVLAVIDYMKTWYRIDPDRVYLTGASMGGGGTWELAARHPDLFAAAAPVCGYTMNTLLENLRNVPVLNQHGGSDWTVPIDLSRYAIDALQELGYTALHKEIPEAGHSITGLYSSTDWMLTFRRPQKPSTVTFTCRQPDRAYWLAIRQFTDTHLGANVTARTDGHGAQQSLVAKLTNIAVLELDLTQTRLDRKKGLLLQIDYDFIEQPGPLPARLFLVRTEKGWSVVEQWTPPDSPTRPYRAGADANLFTGEPLMIVYGTQCEDARRQLWLAVARNLSSFCGGDNAEMPAGRFPVKADREVTAEDMLNYNLILLGGDRENALVALMQPKLPFSINAEGELLADDREPVSLSGTILQASYYNPLAPQRLIHLIATDDDSEDARKALEEPRWLLNGVWADEPGDVPDLAVTEFGGHGRRRMQFTHDWRWLNLPGADRKAPASYYSKRKSNQAMLKAMQQTAHADFALFENVPVESDAKPPIAACLTMADIGIKRAPLATVIGSLTGEELTDLYAKLIDAGKLAAFPAFMPKELDPRRLYRVVMPADYLWMLSGIQRNLRDTAAGPLVPQEAIQALWEP